MASPHSPPQTEKSLYPGAGRGYQSVRTLAGDLPASLIAKRIIALGLLGVKPEVGTRRWLLWP